MYVRSAAKEILGSRDFVSVLVGDAGTGKTTVLTAIEGAHLVAGGKRFIPLAPTTKARDALVESGFDAADTVQRFLVSEAMQREAVGRVLLVDEAGLLSTQQLDHLTKVALELRARVLLVGDTKQHYSVERGDALRNVIVHSGAPVNTATYGSSAIAGSIATIAAVGAIIAMLSRGFAEGGYTGAGGKFDPAGLVHRGEYVFSQADVNRIGLANLESIRSAPRLPGYAAGGPVSTAPVKTVSGSTAGRAPTVYLVDDAREARRRIYESGEFRAQVQKVNRRNSYRW